MLPPEPTTLPSLLQEVLGQDVTALTQCSQVSRGVGKGWREEASMRGMEGGGKYEKNGAVEEAIQAQISSEAGIAQKLCRLTRNDKRACNKTLTTGLLALS